MISQNATRPSQLWQLFGFLFMFLTLLPNVSYGVTANTESWYQVDIIIFSQITNAHYQSEAWLTPTPLHQPINTQVIIDADTVNQSMAAYTLLPDEQFDLTKALNKLNNDHQYHVIWHGAWVQPIYKRHRYQPTYLAGGQVYSAMAEMTNALTALPTSEFTGLLTFVPTGNYIAVTADLRLTEMTDTLGNTANFLVNSSTPYQQFALQQTQRLRTDEVHYFDHPLFGMLIKLTPYTPAKVALHATDSEAFHYPTDTALAQTTQS